MVVVPLDRVAVVDTGLVVVVAVGSLEVLPVLVTVGVVAVLIGVEVLLLLAVGLAWPLAPPPQADTKAHSISIQVIEA